MTLVSEIIADSYRQSNLIAIGTTPTANQQNEGLRYLSRLVTSVYGNEAGERLNAFPLGRVDIDRPSGWPWFNNVPPNQWFVPINTQLMCNLSVPAEVWLAPQPGDGGRFGVNDVAGNFSTNPLTISGNGRRIDGMDSITLDVDGTIKIWFYRDDLGEWVTISPITLDGVFPFPPEFDMYFISLLAMTLNPMYGIEMNSQVGAMMTRSETQFKARYSSPIETPAELGLLRMPRQSRERRLIHNYGYYWDPSATFRSGYPW